MRDENQNNEADDLEWIKDFKREVLKLCGRVEMEDKLACKEEWMKQAMEDREEIWEKIYSKIRE